MKEIILASASPRRADLLRQIGIRFKTLPSNIDENIDASLSPEVYAESLAWSKAMSVADSARSSTGAGTVVIGADTIVVKEGILGKPRDEEEAFRMLKTLQGQWHHVVTGISVIDALSLRGIKAFEVTKVKMRELSDDTIRAYIKTGEPMDKAGAYGIQGMGSVLVERIEGCYFNVVGLPLTKLALLLEQFGIKVLG